MAVFMEGRLTLIAALSAACWGLGRLHPLAGTLLQGATFAYSMWYGYLLWKTLKATVLGPLLWGTLSRFVVARYLTRHEFFRADCPLEEIALQREAALDRLSASWKERWAKAQELQKYLHRHFSDLRFKASGFESMYPIFQHVVNDALDPITIVESSEGNELTDICGCKFLDVSGSYGVNCFGYTKSKEFLAEGQKLAATVGPCLGPMHPVVAENVAMLLNIFRKEEVSFHMSGTEAVMSAVYQARFHTQRRLTVVFQGSYHGWWDGVMQGAGNDRFASDCLILKDQCPASLELLRLRRSEVAAVVINPIAGFGWKNAGTNKLGHAKVAAGAESIERFRAWLCQVRETCTKCGIPLIYDETWAFHLGPGGAQDFYGVEADILVLGKSLGGGHATGAVLGPTRLMERRDLQRPMRVNFVVGTFKGNPVVMGSMNAVLKWVTTPEAAVVFNAFQDRIAKWKETCNAALEAKDLPIRVAAHRSTWCICYLQPSAYHFLFQYYLRDAGLQMAWVGTGKLLFNLEFSEADLKKLTDILIEAAVTFKADGWWWEGGQPVRTLPLILGPTLRYHMNAMLSWLGLGVAEHAP